MCMKLRKTKKLNRRRKKTQKMKKRRRKRKNISTISENT